MDLLSKIFRDENGNFVIAQFPNLPIILAVLAFISSFLTLLLFDEKSETITLFTEGLEKVGWGWLLVWSLLEARYGVNLFRKLLGSICVIVSIAGLLF